ncbi:MAG: hypothetical protein BIFFINMI_03687 [Phycisphaerae bacterium]|nr:hypothetical protein [Phycisphaerae bacterium]
MTTNPLIARKLFLALPGLLLAGLAGCQGMVPPDGVKMLKDANAAYENGDYRQTLSKSDEFLKVHAATNGAGEAYYLRGLAYAQMRDRQRAAADFQQVLKVAKRSDLPVLARVGMGNLYFEQWQLPAARQEYQAVVEKLPNKSPKDLVLYRLGLCNARMGDWGSARGWFSQVLHLFPDSPTADSSRRYLGSDGFSIQCGAFEKPVNATEQVELLRKHNLVAERRMDTHGLLYLVQVGHYRSYEDARVALGRVRGVVSGAIIVP